MGKIIAIGHIVNDTEPMDHLGGPVSYTSVTAAKLGHEVHMLTKCPPNHPYIALLGKYGVTVHVLESKLDTIETNVNVYDDEGHKHFMKLAQQEPITLEDVQSVSSELLKDATIMCVSDSGELDLETIPYLASLGNVGALLQGYFRVITDDKKIMHKEWFGDEKNLPQSQVIILSEEDATVDGVFRKDILDSLKNQAPITVVTQGHDGSTVYTKTEEIKIQPFQLSKEETKDFNGAGDVYTAAFLTKYFETKDVRQAGTFASFLAGLKLMGIGGIGMDSIPTKQELQIFIESNHERVEKFYSSNNVLFNL